MANEQTEQIGRIVRDHKNALSWEYGDNSTLVIRFAKGPMLTLRVDECVIENLVSSLEWHNREYNT